MVRKEGQENGIGIWEVPGHGQLYDRITRILNDFIAEQEFVDSDAVELADVYVFGSYGNGDGVPRESDLDLTYAFMYQGDPRSNDYSQFLRHSVGAVKGNETEVLSGFSQFTEIDAYAYPFSEAKTQLRKQAQHEPVDTYYSLADQQQISLW